MRLAAAAGLSYPFQKPQNRRPRANSPRRGAGRVVLLFRGLMSDSSIPETAEPVVGYPQILLVCPYNLFRQALALLLQRSSLGPVAHVATTAEADATFFAEGTVEMVLLCSCDQNPDAGALIAKLCSENPRTNVVVITSQFDAAQMAEALNAGVDGYLTADMSVPGLVHSLELVRSGEKVFPSQLAEQLAAGNLEVVTKEEAEEVGPLTAREHEIMRCIVRGDSNKVIAGGFSITEATVKMHLRQIFSKIEVSNRTQAAAWALSNGMKPAA